MLILFAFTACANDDLNNTNNESIDENNVTEQKTEAEKGNDNHEEEQTNENYHVDQHSNLEQEQKYRTMTGIYVGQADPHTIEVETDEGPVAYQLSDDARLQVEVLSAGDEVIYEYYERGEQLVIETIEKTKGNNLIIETGIYNGQADPHTIEIETPRGTYAFQLTMEAREQVEKLNPGDKVRYFYVENGDFREISKIEKVEE